MLKKFSFYVVFSLILVFSFNFNDVKANENTHSYSFILLNELASDQESQDLLTYLKNKEDLTDIQFIEDVKLLSFSHPRESISVELNIELLDQFDSIIESINSSAKIQTEIKRPENFNTLTKYSLLSSNLFDVSPWNIMNITDGYKSHSITKGTKEIKVAVIDSGIDYKHPALSGSVNLVQGKSYVPNDPSLMDRNGHGTQIAGVIAANGQWKGIVPDITIVPYKVLGEDGGESVWVIQAIIDAANNDSNVINLSLGTYKAVNLKNEKAIIKAYKRAIQYANKKNSIVVASAGNEGINLDKPLLDSSGTNKQIHLPGGMHNLITVSGTDKMNVYSDYSNYGKEIDFSAPSGSLGPNFYETYELDPSYLIYTTYPTDLAPSFLDSYFQTPNGYTLNLGTSLAAPAVSGALAAIITEYYETHGKIPHINKSVKYLKDGALDLGAKGKDDLYGHGQVNLYNSLLKIGK